MQTFTVHKPAIHSRHGLVAAQNRHAAIRVAFDLHVNRNEVILHHGQLIQRLLHRLC